MTGSPNIPKHDIVRLAVEGWLEESAGPLVVGLCGSQGSGKSTLAAGLASDFGARGIAVEVLSLDDLYLPPDQRPVDIHPLFATRGVPGTHDVALGMDVLDNLIAGKTIAVPRFDKSNDAPFGQNLWHVRRDRADIILFEGWCVGAAPQEDEDLSLPVNDLEREEDMAGIWRRHVNTQLAGPYRDLFARIDKLVLLAAPGFEVVQAWRTQQEHGLSRMLEREGRTGKKVMSDGEVAHFIQHYERLTRYILSEMPGRADLTIRLDENRAVI